MAEVKDEYDHSACLAESRTGQACLLAQKNKEGRLTMDSTLSTTPTSIAPQELSSRLEDQKAAALLVDVRTPVEFQEVHVQGAVNIPLDRVSAEALSVLDPKVAEKRIFVICKGGARGEKARQKLLAEGLGEVVNVEGGTEACLAAGLPTTRGRKVMSLERQVRIAAGSLVFIGVMLGTFVHPGFYGLSGFVGAGLVVAGITDFCGMGLLIARMPWNQ